MSYQHIKVPSNGAKITVNADHSLTVPNNPVIPFITGDGIGVDITPVMQKVVDAAVKKAYHGEKQIHWIILIVIFLSFIPVVKEFWAHRTSKAS